MGLRFLKVKASLSTAPVVIIIHDEKALLLRGRVSPSILASFTDIAKKFGISEAVISVRKSGGSTLLRFSGDVPDTARQRFRNIWFSFPERKMTSL